MADLFSRFFSVIIFVKLQSAFKILRSCWFVYTNLQLISNLAFKPKKMNCQGCVRCVDCQGCVGCQGYVGCKGLLVVRAVWVVSAVLVVKLCV